MNFDNFEGYKQTDTYDFDERYGGKVLSGEELDELIYRVLETLSDTNRQTYSATGNTFVLGEYNAQDKTCTVRVFANYKELEYVKQPK